MPNDNSPESLLRLASQLRQAGRVVEAIQVYERLLALHPDLPDSWYNLAWLQRRARHFDAALASYQQALDRGVKGPEEVHLNRAVIFADDLSRPDEAQRELTRALALNPRYVPAWLNLGNLHEDRGDRDQAAAAYEQVLSIEPGHALALSRLPGVKPLAGADDPLLGQVRRAISRPGASAAEQADLGFSLGKALDAVGAYDDAFAAYAAANLASRRGAGRAAIYDAKAHERLVDDLIRAFPPGQSIPAEEPAFAGPTPLFVCGMFRSGSTLVERILAGHGRVTAGGELDLLPSLQRDSATPGPPDARTRLQLRDRYLAGLAARFPGADIVTDKRPDNFLHIGLIKSLFPRARIVHTRRDPIDNCLSIYFLHLGHAMPYALDLEDTAHWYRQYQRLMAHWKTLFGDGIHDVGYDELVANPRPAIERLLAHAGLDWDEACLAFHQRSGVVKTASVWQVRQALYTSSSGRWWHYARHLGALRAALAAD